VIEKSTGTVFLRLPDMGSVTITVISHIQQQPEENLREGLLLAGAGPGYFLWCCPASNFAGNGKNRRRSPKI
jgi:hypothetical protein